MVGVKFSDGRGIYLGIYVSYRGKCLKFPTYLFFLIGGRSLFMDNYKNSNRHYKLL